MLIKHEFDREHFASLLKYFDVDRRRYAERCGVSTAEICKLAKGRHKKPSADLVGRLASGFPEPIRPSALLKPGQGAWTWASQIGDRGVVNDLFRFMKYAKNLLAVGRNFGSFLIPGELHAAIRKTPLRRAYGDESKARTRLGYDRETHRMRQEARSACSYLLKIIGPGRTLDLAAKRRRADWLDHVADGMKRHWQDTAVGLVSDEAWARIDLLVRSKLIDVDWVKINVADTALCVVYTYDSVFYSDCRETISRVKSLIEDEIALEIEYPFPTKDREEYSKEGELDTLLRCSHRAAIRAFDARWRPSVEPRREYAL